MIGFARRPLGTHPPIPAVEIFSYRRLELLVDSRSKKRRAEARRKTTRQTMPPRQAAPGLELHTDMRVQITAQRIVGTRPGVVVASRIRAVRVIAVQDQRWI